MKKTISLFVILQIAISAIFSLDQAGADYSPKVGTPHFDFELPRIDNRKPIKLSDFRGKKVLLLHFASW